MTYIALLRGINVSGHRMIKMADLVKIFESLKCTNVRTYVQSGNVVFETGKEDTARFVERIEKEILKRCGFEVRVVLRTAAELESIVAGNPLMKRPDIDRDKLHVTYLSAEPTGEVLAGFVMAKAQNEIYLIKGREVYLYCPNGYGISKLNNLAFEKKLKTSATTRNWKTTTTLLALAKAPTR